MTYGAEIWGPMLASAAASGASGLLSGSGVAKETKREKQARKTADELLASLKGDGPFASLFNRDDGAFQKSIVDPAMSRFRNQIAPGIQQMYGASGMSRGTAMDDALLRAGVDLDQNINQLYLPFMQGQQQNSLSMLSNILGQPAGAARQPSMMQNFAQGIGGFLGSDAFSKGTENIFNTLNKPASSRDGRAPGQGYNVMPTPRGHLPEFGQTGGL